MNTEQLLKPRYKVIADYPENDIEVGTILTCQPDGTVTDFKVYDFTESESFFKKYPHLFQKLEWHEDIEASDMPLYLKDEKFNIVYKVLENFVGRFKGMVEVYNGKADVRLHYSNLLPATLSDYTAYINQTKPTI